MCQCPQRASTHFYSQLKLWRHSRRVCQCPQRASTHFYLNKSYVKLVGRRVSMPSTGFYSFLPSSETGWRWAVNLVSMPSTGFYSFLRREYILEHNKLKCVNALNGLYSFLRSDLTSDWFYSICVNALNGLLLISTEPEEKNKSYRHKVSMPSTGFYSFLR